MLPLHRLVMASLLTLTGLAFLSSSARAEPLASLDDLLKEYRALGLPLPPKEAKLVRYEAGGGGIVNGEVQPTDYALAFLITQGEKSKRPVLLVGTWQMPSSWINSFAKEDDVTPAVLKGLLCNRDADFILAIQCHERGWTKLARILLEASDTPENPRSRLVKKAWYYWMEHLFQPKVDRNPIAKRLKYLIQQAEELNTKENRALLKSLDLALLPRKGKPGSIDALIDDMVDCCSNGQTTFAQLQSDDRYWKVAGLGFRAVPSLIEHLEDERLTRISIFGNEMHIFDLVGRILCELAGDDVCRKWTRNERHFLEKADILQWWEQARKEDESAYLLSHVLPTENDRGIQRANFHQLQVLRIKYPDRIPSLYQMVLVKRPELKSDELAETLFNCKLPVSEKLDLLAYATGHKDNKHRQPALLFLSKLDRKRFTPLLIATIEAFPKDVPGPYWLCAEADIARLAVESDDPRVWQTLEKVARRSALGLRMELLHSFRFADDARYRPERVRLLAAFLDDNEEWDQDSDPKFAGPGAGFPYDKLQVRDFIALELARLLDISVETDLKRTREDWSKIRNQVQTAVQRELSKKP